jgi:hypothetical protein
MTSEGFFSNLLEVSDSIFCCRDGRGWECIRDGSRLISHHEEEGGGISGVMFLVVMNEFHHRKMLDPFRRIGSAIDSEIGFKFLVQVFCLSICLGMIGGG